MKRSKHKIRYAALLALIFALMLTACNRVDTTDDPLSAYETDSAIMPSPTPVPAAEVTPAPTVYSYTFSRLEYGDSGEEVLRLQNRLIELGYMDPGSADGIYGDSTKVAVKAFQGALGLSKTGIANINLQQKLFLSNAPYYVEPTPTPAPIVTPKPTSVPTANTSASSTSNTTDGFVDLRKGDYGEKVKTLQTRLISLGYLTGKADGSYGTQTVNAVKDFQAAAGMDQTGVATVFVQEVLFSSGAPAKATPKPTATSTPTVSSKPANPTPTATPREYQTLKYGSYNSSVYNMQKRLRELGYMSGKADGDYGQLTVEAVERFQQALGMEIDGTSATGYLQQRLYADDAPVYVAPTAAPTAAIRQLSNGDTGDDVKRLQKRLKELGYFSGNVGGNYLSQTTAAVKKFQAAAGFDVTGVATVELLEFLYSSDAPAASGAPAQATSKPSAAAPAPTLSATASPYKELRYGDSGKAVKSLQSRLLELGYFSGNVAGNYLEKTQSAVKKFQEAAGFDVTGVATVELQAFLFSDNAPKNAQSSSSANPTASPSSGYVLLSYGDSGNRVKKLQSRLKELGYFDGNVAGNYLEKTRSAVAAFQRAVGFADDGVATVETQQALFASDAPQAGTSNGSSGQYTSLSAGASGQAVKRLQARLIELGYMNGSADGDYGALTIEAVKRFQRALGMEATGSATGYQQERLFASDAPAYGQSASAAGSYIRLSAGDEGNEVRNLQKRLYELGFYKPYEEWNEQQVGKYDDDTVDAVRAFQLACGYGQSAVDGIATVELQQLIFSEEALRYTPPDLPQ